MTQMQPQVQIVLPKYVALLVFQDSVEELIYAFVSAMTTAQVFVWKLDVKQTVVEMEEILS